jgi:hypothetical protein
MEDFVDENIVNKNIPPEFNSASTREHVGPLVLVDYQQKFESLTKRCKRAGLDVSTSKPFKKQIISN